MNNKPAAPKERIMATAFRLFHQQGYNSTGINQIIKESDVAKASLYQLFHSKEELCIEYLNKRHDYWFTKLTGFTFRAKTPATKVTAAFDFIYEMNIDENFRGCSFLNILSEITADNTSILSVIQSHKQDLRDFFKKILPGEKQDTIDHIYLLFESAIIESQLFRSQWPIDKSKKIITSILKQNSQ
jgi:AcrR family transcriptional regulator